MSSEFCSEGIKSINNIEELLFYSTYCKEVIGLNESSLKNLFISLKNSEYVFNVLNLLVKDKEFVIKQTIGLLKDKLFHDVKDNFVINIEGKNVLLPKLYYSNGQYLLQGEKLIYEENQLEQYEDNIFIFREKSYFKFSKTVLLLVRFLKILEYKFFDYDYLITKDKEILLSEDTIENIFNFTENPYHILLKFAYYGDYYKDYFVLEFFKLFTALLLSGYTKINPNNFSCSKVSNFLFYLDDTSEDVFSDNIELIEKYTISDKTLVSKNLGFTSEIKVEDSKKVIKNISENHTELNTFPLLKVSNSVTEMLNITTLKLLYKITDINISNFVVNRLIILKNIYA